MIAMTTNSEGSASADPVVTYRSEDGATVRQGDVVYDYYTMEPVEIGDDLGDGWFETLEPGTRVRSSAGMLSGTRICTIDTARRRGFPGLEPWS